MSDVMRKPAFEIRAHVKGPVSMTKDARKSDAIATANRVQGEVREGKKEEKPTLQSILAAGGTSGHRPSTSMYHNEFCHG